MKIILDVTRLVRRLAGGKTLTGIDRVSFEYAKHFAARSQALFRWNGRNILLSMSHSQKLFAWLVNPQSKYQLSRIITQGITYKKPAAGSFLINTGHIGLKQPNYVRMIQKLKLKPVFFVHDLIPIIYPEYCSTGEDERHKAKMNHILKLASGIITNSKATLQDLQKYANTTNQKIPKTTVSLLATGVKYLQAGPRPIKKPYFVILSTIDPRKNHYSLLNTWRYLVQNFQEKTPHLVIIGKRGWECEQVIDMLERCQFLKGFVTEISNCNDQDLTTYLAHSQALLFPSFAEGYGLPLIEALELKVPVIASHLDVFKEIAGDVPEYIAPHDGIKWGKAIMDYAKFDCENRKQQLERLDNFNLPTWDEHFIRVDSFLEEISCQKKQSTVP
ncbi:MAG: glycosyltransferase family 1 protein [Legionellaceae bacterium]|nr:glycosyltransferase family 1 protein [Legionellaceae bacterium]